MKVTKSSITSRPFVPTLLLLFSLSQSFPLTAANNPLGPYTYVFKTYTDPVTVQDMITFYSQTLIPPGSDCSANLGTIANLDYCSVGNGNTWTLADLHLDFRSYLYLTSPDKSVPTVGLTRFGSAVWDDSIYIVPDTHTVYTLDHATLEISVVPNATVNLTEYALPTAPSGPQSITAGPDGALWFTENGGNKIGRITTAGAVTEYTVPTGISPTSALLRTRR